MSYVLMSYVTTTGSTFKATKRACWRQTEVAGVFLRWCMQRLQKDSLWFQVYRDLDFWIRIQIFEYLNSNSKFEFEILVFKARWSGAHWLECIYVLLLVQSLLKSIQKLIIAGEIMIGRRPRAHHIVYSEIQISRTGRLQPSPLWRSWDT